MSITARKIQFYTVGWNLDKKLIPIPILGTYTRTNEQEGHKLFIDSFQKTALNNNYTILILDRELFNLDHMGDNFRGAEWYCIGDIVQSNSVHSALTAISKIKEIYAERGILLL